MVEQRIKAVQMFSQEEIFRAIAYGALKARAGRLAPGEIMLIGEFELTVAEDENGEGSSCRSSRLWPRWNHWRLAKCDRRIRQWRAGVSMSGEPGWPPSGENWLNISTSGRISK